MRLIARLTNRYELHFDPADLSPSISGRRPIELKYSPDCPAIQAAVCKLVERQEQERRDRGIPLLACPDHRATLQAAFDLNIDIAPYQRRYMEEVA